MSDAPIRARLAGDCLRLGFTAMCAGLAWNALRYEDAIFSMLFMTFGWSEGTALLFDHAGAWALLLAAAVSWSRLGAFALSFVSTWTALLMVASVTQEVRCPWLIPLEQAGRYLGPLALALLLARTAPGPDGSGTRNAAVCLLRVAAAATFIGHGVNAILGYGTYVDLILMADARLFGIGLDQATATAMLRVIGVIDLVLGALILVTRSRWVAGYMAAWGFVTAASRVVHSGLEHGAETLIRLPNGAVPLAILLWWLSSGRAAGHDPRPLGPGSPT